MSIPIGVLGSPSRAFVHPDGGIGFANGERLRWWIRGAERWYEPALEPTLRQRLVDDVPVVETTLRVQSGDVALRVFAVPDDGGCVVIDLTNESSEAIAVAFSGITLRSQREASPLRPDDIDLPADALTFPVPHRSSLRCVTGIDGTTQSIRRTLLPTADQVISGWKTQTARGPRFQHPDQGTRRAAQAARAFLMLSQDQSIASIVERWRHSGQSPDPLVVASTALSVIRSLRSGTHPMVLDALMGASALLASHGEHRAARDMDHLIQHLPVVEDDPPVGSDRPWDDPAAVLAYERRLFVVEHADRIELLPGFVPGWLGQSIDVYEVATRRGTVSFALRWHGERPALLWESDLDLPVACAALDPSFRSYDSRSETLLNPPRLDQAARS